MPRLKTLFSLVLLLFSQVCLAQSIFENQKPNFLPVDEAFKLQPPIIKNETIIVSWLIESGYYLYRDKFGFEFNDQNITIQSVQTPSSQTIEDPQFGLVEIYKDSVTVLLEIKQRSKYEELELEISYQGCAMKGLCYPPQKRNLLVSRSSQGISETALFGVKNIFALSGTFFIFGMLLAFTPCVLPMLPILSAVIIGLKDGTNHNPLLLATLYVVSMALTYAAFGALVASVGDGVQTIVKQDYIIIFLVFFFVFMAILTAFNFSFSFINKLNSRFIELSKVKSFGPLATASIMGSVSAFIATPCVTPPLAAALGYILQANSIILGFTTLFFLGLGMGAPLIVFGSSFNYLIPKSGKWMLEIKNLLAFALLGIAVWFLERILENSITFTIWTVYTLSTFIFFIVRFIKFRREKASQIVSLISIIALSFNYGIIFMNSNHFPSFQTEVSDNSLAGNWVDKASYESLINYIKANQENHDAAIVKFYADWCIECKHVEKNILTDREVIEKLNQFVLINVDVTEMTNEQNDLLKKYQLYGPPAFVILDSNEFTIMKKSVGSIDKKSMLEFLSFDVP